MKRTVLYIVILSVVAIACDNLDVSDDQADKFIKHYGIGLEDEGVRVITTDNGYLILGSVENPGRGNDICIIQTDKFGNTTTPIKTFGTAFNDHAYSIKPNAGGYIIAGSTNNSTGSDMDVYLLQISKNADLIWKSAYSYTNHNVAYDVIVLENGNLVCTGYTQTNNGDTDILFMEITSTGDSVLSMSSTGNIYDEVAYSIVQVDDRYLFAGSHVHRESDASNRIPSVFLLKWKGYGAPITQEDILKGTNSEARAIVGNGFGEYFVACNVIANDASSSQVHLAKINSAMDTLWGETYAYGEQDFNQANQLIISDDKIYFCGTASDDGIDGDMFIASMNTDGRNASYLYTGDGETYTANGFDLTPDGGFILTGKSELNENSTIALGKMNQSGGL